MEICLEKKIVKVKINNTEDFYKDGILHCGICGKPKQYHLHSISVNMTVPVMCDCEKKASAEEKREIQEQEKAIKIRDLRKSSMMATKFYNASFSDYKVRSGNERAYKVAVSYVQRFPEMAKQNQGLLFYGSVGTGKSFTAACIANALIEKQLSVIMTSFVKILQDIQANSFYEADIMRALSNASLLILDDLGAERSTDYAQEIVYNVVDSRIRANRPMIITTNLRLDSMMNTEDMRYSRIYDRVLECCYPVELSGQSFRKEAANERFEQMRRFLE